ncbi:MAG: ADP-ribosylglycohydrolase family protein [Verrucomicrobiales bacterium]|nr:ADP-ribosylglycohydrolase family protein [Verrucomicrobiales bacterium]
MSIPEKHEAILGCLFGTAVGDSIGLPFEGLHPGRAQKINGNQSKHRFVFGRGMLSDDTEHTLMVANALCQNRGDSNAFQKQLGKSFRWWFAALPAGIGLGTARAIIKLWCGFPASKSGVFTAGNGAAMRSAIIGTFFNEDETRRNEYAITSCRITHTDPRAEESALIVACAAALASKKTSTEEVIATINSLITSDEMKAGMSKLETHLKKQSPVLEFASSMGDRGISGFAPPTVSAALFAWLRYRGDFETMIHELVSCGGDTDTVAAIAGGIAGAECGESGIPPAWISGIGDWPRSVSYMRGVAESLADETLSNSLPRLYWPAIPFRNLFFLIVVLLHGFRRLLPPY